MKQIVFYLVLLLSSFSTLVAQEFTFSDSARVSLLTCSPGAEVYEKFGHTALRVKDRKKDIDVVFNYGVFSFETENFYYKFIKGETDYQLGVYATGNFLASYAQRNSLVWEQELNLTPSEQKKLINNLLKNYEPENRIYRYNFVFDNCATRPRDKILGSIKGYVTFAEDKADSKTYRQWIGNYAGQDSWLKFGIDLVFGMDADKSASFSESMFLPEILMNGFQTGIIHTSNNQTRKLILDKKLVIDKVSLAEDKKTSPLKPLNIAILILIAGIALSVWDYIADTHHKAFDSALLIATGLGGIIISYLMFFSSHPLVQYNLNILWMNPLNIILGILMWFPRFRTQVFFYEIFNILLLIAALFSFAITAQLLNVAAAPIIILMLLRSTSWFFYLKKRMYKRRSGL